MISGGSWDTEDRSNDAENSALITAINYTLLYVHILSMWAQLFKIVKKIIFILFFIVQINAALLSKRDLF